MEKASDKENEINEVEEELVDDSPVEETSEQDEQKQTSKRKKDKEEEEEEDYDPEEENEEVEEEAPESEDDEQTSQRKNETTRQSKIRKLKEEEKENSEEESSDSAEDKESEEEGEPEETEDEARQHIRSSLDFATVLHFLDLFREAFGLDDKDVKQQKRGAPPSKPATQNILKPTIFKHSAEKLERALVRCRSSKIAPNEDKGFLIELHIRLMRAVNPKRRPPPNFENWEKSLKNMIQRERAAPASTVSVGAIELHFNNSAFEENPLDNTRYFLLPVLTKIAILKALTEWIMDYNEKLATHISEFEPSELDDTIREEPLGVDSKGYKYWCLDVNDITPRIYREKSKHQWGKNNELIPPAWENVTTSVSEVEALVEDFEGRSSSADAKILKDLQDGVLPALVEEEKKRERMAKKLAKQEVSGLSMGNILFTDRPRRSRREVNYNYNYEGVDFNH